MTSETEHGWRSPERRANAKRGIDQARRRLTIVFDRDACVYRVDDLEFTSLHAAEQHVLVSPEPPKEPTVEMCWFGDGKPATASYWFEPQQVWRPLCASHESSAANNLPEHFIRGVSPEPPKEPSA